MSPSCEVSDTSAMVGLLSVKREEISKAAMETWGKEHRAPLEGSFEGRLVKLEQGFALENSSRN